MVLTLKVHFLEKKQPSTSNQKEPKHGVYSVFVSLKSDL